MPIRPRSSPTSSGGKWPAAHRARTEARQAEAPRCSGGAPRPPRARCARRRGLLAMDGGGRWPARIRPPRAKGERWGRTGADGVGQHSPEESRPALGRCLERRLIGGHEGPSPILRVVAIPAEPSLGPRHQIVPVATRERMHPVVRLPPVEAGNRLLVPRGVDASCGHIWGFLRERPVPQSYCGYRSHRPREGDRPHRAPATRGARCWARGWQDGSCVTCCSEGIICEP